MSNALKKKLTSQRGASLLLALLFLLLCIMVGSSVLMASVSDAGKHRSNVHEHQTYLALSSAVELVCDELNRTEYMGHYQYRQTQTAGKTQRHFVQLDGVYRQIGTEEPGLLKSVLLSDLDGIFAKEIRSRIKDPASFATFELKPEVIRSHTLTVTPQTGTELDSRKVTIRLSVVEESCAVELTATLDDYQIQAELTPTTNKPTLPGNLTQGEQKTDPLQWEIGWIMPTEQEAKP